MFPGQPGDIIFPVCSWSAPGHRSSWTCLKHLTYEAPRRHPIQMPKPPTLALLTWRKVTICEGRNVARQLCFTLNSPFTTTDRNSIRITADTVSLFLSLLPSPVRKTQRYLNSLGQQFLLKSGATISS